MNLREFNLAMFDNILFLENISFASRIVIAIAVIVILWLSWQDFRSYKGNNHKDFKSVIVSIGVLGTFVGIFIGLWNFDSAEISKSVPKLLDGLKTAFFTSIFGMFFAVLLSIIQTSKGLGGTEDEIATLKQILGKLAGLERFKESVEVVPAIHNKLESIDKNTTTLSDNISSVKTELKESQSQLFSFLTEKLGAIDNSLQQAVKALAEGATEQIIQALNGVIADFNNNLTEQFGDNFKQLNEAVFKMIEWQENYKTTIVQSEQSLKVAIEIARTSTEQIEGITEQIEGITEDYATIARISTDLQNIIETNQNQIRSLATHLSSLTQIGEEAGGITKALENFSTQIQGSLSTQAKSVATLTKDIEDQLPRALAVLERSLTTLTQEFANTYQEFLNRFNEIMEQNTE